MYGVVPAAGRGSRLRPATESQPKGLVEVGGEPLLSHVFERLLAVGVAEIVVVVGYCGDQITDQFGARYGDTRLRYVEQPAPVGLADAVARAGSALPPDSDLLVVNGDNVLEADLAPVVRAQRRPDVDATLAVETADSERAGRTGVVRTDEDGMVRSVTEKPDEPSSRVITTGVAAFSAEIIAHCRQIEPSDRGEYELADAITRLVEAGGTVETVRLAGWRINVNTPADRDRAARRLTE